MALKLNPRSLTELSPTDLTLIELRLIDPGGTRPADLVFDPTFAC
jgi:hypothetical protein